MNILSICRRFFTNSVKRNALKVKREKQEEAAAAEAPPGLCIEDRCMVRPTQGCPKIVVIGAGMAGLSAAERLASCGLSTVTVLEAADRLGGRMMSCWLGDMSVELGCVGVGGGRSISNPLFSLAMAMAGGELPYVEPPPRQTVFLTSQGVAIREYAAEQLLFNHMFMEAGSLTTDKTSLLHFLSLRINQELLNYPEEERYNTERLLYGMLNELRGLWGSDLSNISASLIGLKKTPCGPDMVIPQGCLSLLAPLLQGIPVHRIFQKKEVTKVEWKQEIVPDQPRAVVHTADWDRFEADYVILTLPIGVLKEKAADMFSPPLPKSKLNAIHNTGSGVVNKIYAEYSEPWWGGGTCRIRLAWSPQEMLHDGDWTRGICNIASSSRTVMEVRTSGAEAMMLEQCTEEEIAMELTRFFRKLLCDSTIPFPHHIVVTRWGNNPFCKGSFMSLTLKSSEDDLEELKAPVPEAPVPVLLFGGDCSEPSNFGTIDGARIAGMREADRILELTRQFDGPPRCC